MEPYFLGENEEEGEKVSPYWAGRQKQEIRDGKIKEYIDTKRVLTVELLVGMLDMPPSLSSRRIVEARLQRFVQHKYVRQIREGFVTYYVSPLVIKKGHPQLDHKLMESTAWIAFERALTVEHWQSSDQLRKQGGRLIPDQVFAAKRQGYCVEIDTGWEDLATLLSKVPRYLKDKGHLIDTLFPLESVDNLHVLIITKRAGRVAHILSKLTAIISDGMFLVTSQDQFQPFDGSILGPIWLSPTDDNRHSLLEK